MGVTIWLWAYMHNAGVKLSDTRAWIISGYIYTMPCVLQIGVIMSDYPQKALYAACVCHICVITYVHKYKDYTCALLGLCSFKCAGTLPFPSTTNYLMV